MAHNQQMNPTLVRVVLFLQLIPLLLFPPSSFVLTSQTWWLPAILVVLDIVAMAQLFRKTTAMWPLYLLSFAQGFNIISRLLMLMPQSVPMAEGASFDFVYFTLSIIAMIASSYVLWFIERPSVKQILGR
jgi:hypothetical protein